MEILKYRKDANSEWQEMIAIRGEAGKDGYTPIKGVDYFDGKDGINGKDGTSVTHTWDGTTLIVSSASGMSSVDLKGDKGDKGETPDLTGYATEDYVDNAIKNIDINVDGVDIDLSEYAKKTEIPTVPTKVSAFTNDAGYLTKHQSLEGYATEDYVNDKIADINTTGTTVDLSAYAKTADVNTALANKADKGHTHAQYLTEHQSLDGYATETYVDDAVKNIEVTGGGVGAAGEGNGAEIFNDYVHNKASGVYAHAHGAGCRATGHYSTAYGYGNKASGQDSTASGHWTEAKGSGSYTEGNNTIAAGNEQHVQGRYNIEDTEEKYAHIVGNGEADIDTSTITRSNAHTLDWEGNAWFAGGIILNSPNGTRYIIKVTDAGQLSVTESEV